MAAIIVNGDLLEAADDSVRVWRLSFVILFVVIYIRIFCLFFVLFVIFYVVYLLFFLYFSFLYIFTFMYFMYYFYAFQLLFRCVLFIIFRHCIQYFLFIFTHLILLLLLLLLFQFYLILWLGDLLRHRRCDSCQIYLYYLFTRSGMTCRNPSNRINLHVRSIF